MERIKQNALNALMYSEEHPTLSLTKLSEMFGAERHVIGKYKKINDYHKFTFVNQSNPNDEYRYYFSQEELQFIKHYLDNANLSFKEVCENQDYIIPQNTLYRYLPILGHSTTGGKSFKYHYDRTKFQKIETEEDAYWLGFITADGSIIENRWVSISLAEKDIEHLKKFCKYIGLSETETNEIIGHQFGGAYTKDNPIVTVKICSKEIINNLLDKGVFPRKSGKEIPYYDLKPNLQKHYIRGLFDGDGYLRTTEYGWGIVGSYEICQYVKNYIHENIVDMSNINIHEHGTIYKLAGSGSIKTSKIAKHFYENSSIYLDRKYTLYRLKYCRE